MSPVSDPDAIAMELALSETYSPVFHKFQNLPPELRATIWRLAAPRPAVVERSMNNTTMTWELRRHAPVPAVLHSCRESRAELLYDGENHRGSCNNQFELLCISPIDKESRRGVYLNCKNDTLLLYRAPPNAFMPAAANYANVQNLAMEWGLRPCWIQDHCQFGIQFVQQFPALKTLTLLVTFKLCNRAPLGEPGRKHREQTQKRRALREIKQWVSEAVEDAKTKRPSWTPPELRIVPRTKYWSPAVTGPEVKKSV